MSNHLENILIIKLSALGDFVQATTAFSAIRQHYPNAQLTLLTTPLYENFAKRLSYFDHILLDMRPKWHHLNRLREFIRTLRASQFDSVFDLQGVDRTRIYKRFLQKNVQWFSHPPSKKPSHPQERFQQLFNTLEINFSSSLDLRNLGEPISFPLKKPYVLVIPGASHVHGGQKRWPEECYAQLANYLIRQDIHPVIIGGPDESFPLINQQVPEITDLVGQTNFYQIIKLAQHAAFAVGNDTGPMLLAASGRCPTFTLYSKVNPPTIGGARGDKNLHLFKDRLESLTVEEVIGKIKKIL